MYSTLHRRSFLQWMGAGAAMALLPSTAPGGWGRSALLQTDAAGGLDGGVDYFERFDLGRPAMDRVLAKGLSRGGDFSELYLQHTVQRTLVLQDGEVNQAFSSVDLGAGIRVLKGDSTGYAFSEDLSETALLQAADTAASVVDRGAEVEAVRLREGRVPNRYPIAVSWNDIGLEKRLPILTFAEDRARAVDSRIIRVTVNFSDSVSRVVLANSEGRFVADNRPMASFHVSMVARSGDRTERYGEVASARRGIDFFDQGLLSRTVDRAGERVLSLFDAVDAPVGEVPVVLAAGRSGILLHEAVGHGMEADFNRKGRSIYSDMIGRRIAPREVTIVDDGTIPHLRGTVNIDDEGTEGQRTVLVDKGVLRSYMHDRISARHYGVKSTGSGRRQDFRHPPVPRMRNTLMLDGPRDPGEIIASVKRGLYAEDFGNGEVRIGEGDFTFYLRWGRLIENGRLTGVVKDANLIGNGPRVLETMEMVGNDSHIPETGGTCGKDGQWVPVTFGLPTVRVGAISVGGRMA